MKDTKKRRLNVISSTFFTIVGLLACFTGTMAWFTSIRMKQGAADQFVVSSGNLPFKKVEIFQQDLTNANEKNPYRFSTISSGSYTSSTTSGQPSMTFQSGSATNAMQEYDSLNYTFTQCIMYLFTVDRNVLSTDPDSIYIGAKTTDSTTCLFISKEGTTEPENTLKQSDNSLSNVINFRVVPLTSALTASDSYYDLTSSLSSTTSSSFIYSDKDTDFDTHGLLNDSSKVKNSLSLFSNTDKNLVQVAVIVSYDDFLINNLYTINLGSDVLNNSVSFTPDWRFVI